MNVAYIGQKIPTESIIYQMKEYQLNQLKMKDYHKDDFKLSIKKLI